MTLIRDERGQMAVEFAIVTPVILLILVIAIDAIVFAGECAKFDQVVPQHILALATSPTRDSYDASARVAAVQSALDGEFSKNGSSVTVRSADAQVPLASMVTYTCTLRFAPWPLSLTHTNMALEHVCAFSVDPYTPGELL